MKVGDGRTDVRTNREVSLGSEREGNTSEITER